MGLQEKIHLTPSPKSVQYYRSWKASLMPQPLILTWATTPSGWILDPTASKMCTIIFSWGNYSYKRLPMGFGGSADIFQAQIMDLMASLKFIQAYMDDLFIITKRILDKHLQKWRQC
jgi:hypothetical protein